MNTFGELKEDWERSSQNPFQGNISSFTWRCWRKAWKTSAERANVVVKNQTGQLSHTSQ